MRPDATAELLALIDTRAAQILGAPMALLGTMASPTTVALDGGPTVGVMVPGGVAPAVGRRVLCLRIQGGHDIVVLGRGLDE